MMTERDINCKIYNENKGISTDEKAVVLFDKNLVEKAIENFLQETIAPALRPYADVLIQQCTEAIEKIVVQNVIERADAEVQIGNKKRILERTKQIFKDEVNNNDSHKFPVSEMSKAEAVERAKLTQKWMDGIGNIQEEDEELSAIWEGWFIEMNKDTKTTDQKRSLDIMKTLSAEEAKLMLYIKERREVRFKTMSINNRSHSIEKEKRQYLINLLQKKELISKISILNSKTIIPFFSLIVMVIGAFIGYTIMFRDSLLSEFARSPIFIIVFIAILFFILSPTITQKRYQLTWIGEKIVSYAKKNTERSRVYYGNDASR